MRLALLLILLLSAGPALAQRPSTLSMTCSQAQNLVARQGEVVLSTGRNTFDRFVASPRYCYLGEWAEPATAPTADAARCPLGYICQASEPFFDDWRLRGWR